MEVQIDGDIIQKVIRAAQVGGDYAADNQHTLTASEKSDGSIVTESDVNAESLIREELSDSPYPVVGEEGEKSREESSYWVVDPIDGTANYWRKQPIFNTTVALIKEDEIMAGCVYSPLTNETFYAQKGHGAFLNEMELPQFDEEINNSFAGVDGIVSPSNIGELISSSDYGFQKLNSAALTLSYLAARRFDTAVIGTVNIWDIAAGVLISREAGATVTSYSTNRNELEDIMNGKIVLNWADDNTLEDALE